MSQLLSYTPILLILCPLFVLLVCYSRVLAALITTGLAVLMLLPFDGLNFLEKFTGIVAQPSITSILALLIWPVLRFQKRRLNNPDALSFALVIAVFSLILYPMALGLGAYDPYALGYTPQLLLGALAVLGFVAASYRFWLCTATIIAILASYWIQLLPSTNLWDYMLDPIIGVFSLVYLVRYFWRRKGLSEPEAQVGKVKAGLSDAPNWQTKPAALGAKI